MTLASFLHISSPDKEMFWQPNVCDTKKPFQAVSHQQKLPTWQQGLLPATALLAPSTNVIAQSAPRCRLLITASAMCDMLQQCKARIGPTANGRHHKKQCHAPLPIALLLPFIIEEQTVLKSKKEHGGEWGVTVRDIVRILTGSFPFSKY